MENIIFIAPPAAGKGTQSELLKEKYNYNHISTGDMLRSSIASGSPLGLKVKSIIDAGGLVSDDIMIDLIKDKLNDIGNVPFILDGFPRTLPQAEALEELLKENNISYKVIYLELDEEVARKRILGRRTCECGRSYNIYDEELKPKVSNICDYCGKPLIQRADDNEESFKTRYDTFLKNTKSIMEYYQGLNNLIKIDVNRNKDEIFKDIEKAINND